MDSDRFKFIIVPMRKSGVETEPCSRLFLFSASDDDTKISPVTDDGDLRRRLLVELCLGGGAMVTVVCRRD